MTKILIIAINVATMAALCFLFSLTRHWFFYVLSLVPFFMIFWSIRELKKL